MIPEKEDDEIVNIILKNARVQTTVLIHRRIVKIVDEGIARRVEIPNILKSENSVFEFISTYLVNNAGQITDGVIGGTISGLFLKYFNNLKRAKDSPLSERPSLYEEMKSILNRCPQPIRDLVDLLIRELSKPINKKLSIEKKNECRFSSGKFRKNRVGENRCFGFAGLITSGTCSRPGKL
jgi:hypothetical protein